MSTAMLVNLILSKLRTGRVDFLEIAGERVTFEYAGRCYEVFENGDEFISVMNVIGRLWAESDSYSRWIEGVLNGKTRDEQGVLA